MRMKRSADHLMAKKRGKQCAYYICKVCGKEWQSTNIKEHIEAIHNEDITIPSTICHRLGKALLGLFCQFFVASNKMNNFSSGQIGTAQ